MIFQYDWEPAKIQRILNDGFEVILEKLILIENYDDLFYYNTIIW